MLRFTFCHPIIAGVLTLSLLACGTGTPAPAGSPPSSQAASPPSAPASSPAASKEDAEWQKVMQAAKGEGSVVVYGTTTEDEAKAQSEAFGKLYPGIQLEWVNIRGSEMMVRIQTEQAAGKYLADLVRAGGPNPLQLAKDGMMVEFTPAEAKKPEVRWLIDPLINSSSLGGDKVVVNYLTVYYVLINTNLIRPADEPKSFKDLADPKYKGKIMLDDPRGVGPGNRAFTLLYKMYGEEWIKKLLSNANLTRSLSGDPVKVARGEYAVLVMPTSTNVDPLLDQGLPIKALFLEEGLPVVTFSSAIVKNPPHPNAAKVFQNYLLSKEAAAAAAQSGATPIRADVRAKRPEFDLNGKKLFPGNPSDFETETVLFPKMVQKARELLGE